MKRLNLLSFKIMKTVITAALLVICSISFSQNGNLLWKTSTKKTDLKSTSKINLPLKQVFDLDLNLLKNKLVSSPSRNESNIISNTVISLPNSDGNLENFKVYENPIMDPELTARYPEIKSYIAIGIDNPRARAYFSNSPLGFKSMTLYPNQSAVFIEPVTSDLKTYTIYKKSDKEAALDKFECNVIDYAVDKIQNNKKNSQIARGADDSKLRTFRLALSCTAEYAAYFGGTKSLALAGMNNTLTRINGVFEKDFGVKLILIANNDAIIYTNPLTDPYSDSTSKTNWRTEIQANLNSTIGTANYDIGHLLGANSVTISSGDAGCIGCVCSSLIKGSGYTCANPKNFNGDSFDIDFVAHEIAHQLGANHTYSHVTESASGAQMEPGSGSTIMSYAGSTSKDVQSYSDAYFHSISIQQVTDNVKNKTCAILISTSNAVPVVNAGLDYTIPKGTPFLLTGSATDSNTEDVLTYTWEQMDLGTSSTTIPNSTATAGPLFRSYPPSISPIRYFPNMTTILAGSTTTSGLEIPVEVVSDVTRTLNFRLTVRDNRLNGSANNTDDVAITVDGNSGPFKIDSQNSTTSYVAGTTQSVNWTVAGTDANGVNCATVDIFLSTNGGKTFDTILASKIPNNGSTKILIPTLLGTTNRIMVRGTNHIFFDVNNINFTISALDVRDTSPPSASILSSSGTTTSSTTLSWTSSNDNIGIARYDIYQNGILKTNTTSNSLTVSGLSPLTSYSFYIVAVDTAGNLSTPSNITNVTTLGTADTSAPSVSTLSFSSITTSSVNLSWTISTDNIGVTGYTIYQNGVLKTTTTATSLTISGLTESTVYTFYIVAKDAAGNLSAESNSINIQTLANSSFTPLDKTTIAYCQSSANFTDKEYINKIKIGKIDNTSGNNKGYGNFVSLSTDLTIGVSNIIEITPAWIRSTLSESYCLWIDLNQDGDFEDKGELIFSKSKIKAKLVSETFILPATASIGATRMRISMKNNIIPNSCEIFSYGEVEDYTVNITSASATAKPESSTKEIISETDNILKDTKPSIKLYPNPVKGTILNISNFGDFYNFKIYNMMGQDLETNHIENNTIDISSLKRGIYLIKFTNGISINTKQFIKE